MAFHQPYVDGRGARRCPENADVDAAAAMFDVDPGKPVVSLRKTLVDVFRKSAIGLDDIAEGGESILGERLGPQDIYTHGPSFQPDHLLIHSAS